MTILIAPLSDDCHSSDNFGVKLPRALSIDLAEFRAHLEQTKIEFE
jgi:hypothetical protein